MQKSRINKKASSILSPQVIGILAVIALVYIIAINAGNPGALIYTSNDSTTFYQYAGKAPQYIYRCSYEPGAGCGSSNQCYVDKAFYDAQIKFSDTQTITINSDKYDISVINVRQGQSASGLCAAVIYDATVTKNGVVVDSIKFPDKVGACTDYDSKRIERNYGNLKATFNFDSEIGAGEGAGRCGSQVPYMVNRYSIVTPAGSTATLQNESSTTQTVSGSPNNHVFTTSSQGSAFSRFIQSIKDFFGRLF